MRPDQQGLPFTKGHGTENDFVVLPDLDGELELDADLVRRLCDRRAGLGADGVIRVVRTARAQEPDVQALADQAEWFMDYRNADGSAAEMCGNGSRVFAAYLRREGLSTADDYAIATRAGLKHVRVEGDRYVVNLGPWRIVQPQLLAAQGYDTLVAVRGQHAPWPGLSVDVGNPHTVVVVQDDVDLADLDLTMAPELNPPAAHGSNVELVKPCGPGHLQMRVFERGVGETRACGTGACAAAMALMMWSGEPTENQDWRVDLPGGTVQVRALPGGEVEIAGPAVLVADGTWLG